MVDKMPSRRNGPATIKKFLTAFNLSVLAGRQEMNS